jgi:hypothetical protein
VSRRFSTMISDFTGQESRRLDIWLKLVAALTYCVFAIWLTARNYPWTAGDSARYLDLSTAMLHGHFGLTRGGVFDPEAWRGPGYPAFLAVAFAVFGKSRVAVIVAQHALTLSSIFLTYSVLRREFPLAVGRIFLALCSVYPFIAEATAKFMTESLCLFLISVAVYAISARRPWSPYVAGLFAALAGLVRPNLMLLAFLYAFAYLVVGRNLRKAFALALAAAVTLVPWCVRNYETFGRFSPMPPASGAGSVLMLAARETRVSTDALYNYGMFGKVTPELRNSGMLEMQARINSEVGVQPNAFFCVPEVYGDGPRMIAANKLLTDEAAGLIRNSPGRYLVRTFWNIPRMWFSAGVESSLGRAKRLAMIALGFSIWVLGLGGFMLLIRRLKELKSEAAVVLCLLPVYFTATLCWFQQDARYTVPGRLILLSLAAYAITRALGGKRPIPQQSKAEAV